MYQIVRLVSAGTLLFLFVCWASAQNAPPSLSCDDNGRFCTEVFDSIGYGGSYTGHDEPSLLFYSGVAGSGNQMAYLIQLPKDPPTLPTQNGTGGTFNFQLHPAFWFGMAVCDDQSAPNPGGSPGLPNIPCTPDSDNNIYENPSPSAAGYIGKHPGTAFMEMQFYPPSWVPWPAGNSCDATRWCAALNIDSLSENQNTGQILNSTCLAEVGIEPVNFAFITTSGVAHAPASPVLSTLSTFTPNPQTDLFMNSGDVLLVILQDTPNGLKISIRDVTSGQSGSMTASSSNNFGQVKFEPTGTSCQNIPADFHPMYATSSEHTRVVWAAHSYNIAFSDEIGHFEYCNAVDLNGNCTQAGVPDSSVDDDDNGCFPASASLLVQISGCLGADSDFDGAPYQNTWPGTFTNKGLDQQVHPRPVLFTSPLFIDSSGTLQNYDRVAFENDLPRIESTCNRTTGAGCVNPPVAGSFYPFYTTRGGNGSCTWQLGGANNPGTKETFGGSSAAEYGGLLQLVYPAVGGTVTRYNDFRNVLTTNPCPSKGNIASLD